MRESYVPISAGVLPHVSWGRQEIAPFAALFGFELCNSLPHKAERLESHSKDEPNRQYTQTVSFGSEKDGPVAAAEHGSYG